jgi:16S rRNA processing protein RimM
MKWIPVGKILSLHGTRGEIKLNYYNEVKDDICRYTSLFVLKDDGFFEIKPVDVRFQKGFVYARLKGFNSMEEVSPLVGCEICIRERDLLPLEEGEYYEYQLIGLDVITLKGERMGKVESLIHTGANDILVLDEEGAPMVPLVEGFVVEINMKEGFVRVDGEAVAL